jgi:hypothetical protein
MITKRFCGESVMAARIVVMLAVCAIGLLAWGCSTSKPADDPTTRALSDPMNYAPAEDQDISGGGLTDFHKDAFKKDMDHALNP